MPIPITLKCSLCRSLLNDAVSTNCCNIVYCDECIRKYLLESKDFKCPNCSQECPVDKLQPAKEVRKQVEEFIKDLSKDKPAQDLTAEQPIQAPLMDIPPELSQFYSQMSQLGKNDF